MKKLVLHPDDRSTDFLKRIYKDLDCTVINDFSFLFEEHGKERFRQMLSEYDQIIMLGHGTPYGLLNVYKGKFCGYVINDEDKDILKTKDTISVWCYSDLFYARNNLGDGNLHTGMIISEPKEEAYMLGKIVLDDEKMLDNMNLFADAIHDCINESGHKKVEYILSKYVGDDEVTSFNRRNIHTL